MSMDMLKPVVVISIVCIKRLCNNLLFRVSEVYPPCPLFIQRLFPLCHLFIRGAISIVYLEVMSIVSK